MNNPPRFSYCIYSVILCLILACNSLVYNFQTSLVIWAKKRLRINYYILEIYLAEDNKNKVYYIYCSVGYTSSRVCNVLSSKGYKVVNVLGGYNSYYSA